MDNATFSRLDCGCIVYEDGKRISCSQHRREHPPYIPEADQPAVRKVEKVEPMSLADRLRAKARTSVTHNRTRGTFAECHKDDRILLEAADRIEELEDYIDYLESEGDEYNERRSIAERRSIL